MADAQSVVSTSVLRNVSDKLYEKRKNAALEVEGIVKQLAVAGDHDKITAVINLLTNDYTYSTQANYRKGGLIGLAAATVGLSSEAAQHLESGLTPLEIAAMFGNDEVVMVLLLVTARIHYIQDWTVEGILKYVYSEEANQKRELKWKEHFLFSKSKGEASFKKKYYLDATFWYTEVSMLCL